MLLQGQAGFRVIEDRGDDDEEGEEEGRSWDNGFNPNPHVD